MACGPCLLRLLALLPILTRTTASNLRGRVVTYAAASTVLLMLVGGLAITDTERGGITVLGIATATIASWMVETVGEASSQEETVTRAHVEALSDEVRALRAELSRVAASGSAGPLVADSTTSSSAGERAAPS